MRQSEKEMTFTSTGGDVLLTAAAMRGAIITSYAQVEHLLADIVLRCQPMADYSGLPKTLPYKLETRIALVRQIVGMPGPLQKYQAEFEKIIVELLEFEELRHFMAHGLLQVHTDGDGSHTLIYRMHRQAKGSTIEEGTVTTDLPQLEYAAKQIADHALRAVNLFRDVYRDHSLAPR
jgi:hypothetical protein